MQELDAHVRPVEVAGKIEQVHLEHRAAARGDRGPHAEARDGGAGGGADAVHPHRVDAGERGAVVPELHVGGGETELAPELSPMDDAPADAVRPAEQRFGRRELASGERGADRRARHARAGARHDRHDLDLVSAAAAETFQEREVAGALRAEPEVLADEDPARLEPFREHLLDEGPGLERGKRPREALNMHPLDFVSREQLEFFSQGGEPGRRRLRREEFPRMRFERQHATHQSAPARLADEALEHRPVPEVNAVEIAHGQRDRWQRGVGSAVGKQHEAGEQTQSFEL